MSAKYQQHPMEAKAQADIARARKEREEIDRAWLRWLAWRGQEENRTLTPAEAFRAGWVECKDETKRAQAPQARASEPRVREGSPSSIPKAPAPVEALDLPTRKIIRAALESALAGVWDGHYSGTGVTVGYAQAVDAEVKAAIKLLDSPQRPQGGDLERLLQKFFAASAEFGRQTWINLDSIESKKAAEEADAIKSEILTSLSKPSPAGGREWEEKAIFEAIEDLKRIEKVLGPLESTRALYLARLRIEQATKSIAAWPTLKHPPKAREVVESPTPEAVGKPAPLAPRPKHLSHYCPPLGGVDNTRDKKSCPMCSPEPLAPTGGQA